MVQPTSLTVFLVGTITKVYGDMSRGWAIGSFSSLVIDRFWGLQVRIFVEINATISSRLFSFNDNFI